MLLEHGEYGPFLITRTAATSLFRARVVLEQKEWPRIEYGPYENPTRLPSFITYLRDEVGVVGRDWFMAEFNSRLVVHFLDATQARNFESVWCANENNWAHAHAS